MILLAVSPKNLVMVDKTEVITVHAEEKSEEVALVMHKYDLVALPVINFEGVFLGRITIDEVVDVMKDEALFY